MDARTKPEAASRRRNKPCLSLISHDHVDALDAGLGR